jgi:S-formylglutathione hydrolase FrmB
MLRTLAAVIAFVGLATPLHAQTPAHPVTVELTAPGAAPASGRLIITAMPRPAPTGTTAGGQLIYSSTALTPSPMATRPQWVAAQEIENLAPGQTLTIDTRALAFPADFTTAPAGTYSVRAMLDVNRNSGYNNLPDGGDFESVVTDVALPLTAPLRLALSRQAPPDQSWNDTSWLGGQLKIDADAAAANIKLVEVPSPVMQRFSGKPALIRALILTPPGYPSGSDRYPTVLSFDGFGGRLGSAKLAGVLARRWTEMASGKAPPMIWVVLDNEVPGGAHAFADSASNGPWGQALTTEFIPWLDGAYRTDGRASGRFTSGHSTGGWAALWQQVKYPQLYGGAWATAPDYVDFRRAWETDLYAPGANVYRTASGEPKFIRRARGAAPGVKVADYTRIEDVISDRGGQIASFDWVFSPRGPDGRPLPLFDHATGAVDPRVAQAWKAYDISRILEDSWTTSGSEIARKLHIAVGTIDSYFLDDPVELMDANFKRRGLAADIQLVEGRDHATIVSDARIIDNAWAMYAIARPGVSRPATADATAAR